MRATLCVVCVYGPRQNWHAIGVRRGILCSSGLAPCAVVYCTNVSGTGEANCRHKPEFHSSRNIGVVMGTREGGTRCEGPGQSTALTNLYCALETPSSLRLVSSLQHLLSRGVSMNQIKPKIHPCRKRIEPALTAH